MGHRCGSDALAQAVAFHSYALLFATAKWTLELLRTLITDTPVPGSGNGPSRRYGEYFRYLPPPVGGGSRYTMGVHAFAGLAFLVVCFYACGTL